MNHFSVANRRTSPKTMASRAGTPTAGLYRMSVIALLLIATQPLQGQEVPLSEQLKAAKILKVDSLCEPMRSVTFGYTMPVPNPDKKTWDIVQIYFSKYGGPNEIVTIDTATNEIKHHKIPARNEWQMWHMPEHFIGTNGKLYIGTSGARQYIHMYDPATNKLHLKWATLPKAYEGEGHPMTLGADGMIYAAAHYRGSLHAGISQIDPETGKVVDYGQVGGKDAHGVAHAVATDARYAYVVTGKVPWVLSVYDRTTGESKTLLNNGRKGISLYQTPYGSVAWMDGLYWLHNGKAIKAKDKNEKAPWKAPDKYTQHYITHFCNGKALQKSILRRRPEIFTKNAEPPADGKCVMWVRYDDAKQKAEAEAKLGKTFDTPEAAGWKAYRYTVDTFPKPIARIITMPDGRIFGNGKSYSGEFIYDPKAGKATYLGKTRLSVYTLNRLKGKIYLSGYPRGLTYCYDPAKRWTKPVGVGMPGVKEMKRDDPRQNPRMVGFLSKVSGAHKMYSSAVGEDGLIYFGGRWKRNGNGGGFAWWDPDTRKMGGMSDIFSNYQIYHLASTNYGAGRYIVISTLPVTDITLHKKKPKTGRLFVFDTKAKKIVRTVDPVPEAYGSGFIIGVDGDNILGMATSGEKGKRKTHLYKLNVKTGKTIFHRKLSVNSQFTTGGTGAMGPGKNVWTVLEGWCLVRINPADGGITVVGKVPGGAGRMAFSGRDLYLAGNKDLRRIRNVVPEQP